MVTESDTDVGTDATDGHGYSGSIDLHGILWQPPHMPQMRAHPRVIAVGIIIAEVRGHAPGDDPEQVAHGEERFPGALVAGVGVVANSRPYSSGARWRSTYLPNLPGLHANPVSMPTTQSSILSSCART